jgi:hypothetical protein
LFIAFKIAIAACVVAFASWLSGKRPELAGFITALPLVSIMAIAFSYSQNHNLDTTSQYAKSIILAVPVSWLFFLPFFFPEKIGGFWPAWILGLALLVVGYFIHQGILKII